MAAKKKTSKSTPTVSSSSKSEMRKWEIESALSTLKRADEIRKDSKLMNDVKKMAKEQIAMLGGMVKGK
jgi:hypothetical protein